MSEENQVNVEKQARNEGWAPRDEWRGDPERWVDAETFVARGENMQKSLHKRLDRLENENKRLRERSENDERVKHEMVEIKNRLVAQERKRAEEAIAELKRERALALNEGDGGRFNELSDEIEERQNQVRELRDSKAPSSSELPAEVARNYQNAIDDFKEAHPWYGEDPTLTGLMVDWVRRLRAEGDMSSPGRILKHALEEIEDRFPEKFKRLKDEDETDEEDDESPPPRKTRKGSPVESGERVSGSGKARLTAREESDINEMIRVGLISSREEYLKVMKEI